MRWAAEATLAALVIAGVTTEAFSAAPQENAAAKDKASAVPPSIDGAIGKKLVSIDGSLITLSASEGGLSREIVTPNGAVQKTAFHFLNDRLGTVMDSRDTGKVTGVFRIGGSEINIQYADGSSETVLTNSAGGISIATKSPRSAIYCTTWYPEGHVFSQEERETAVAQYASRLGLADGGGSKIDASAHTDCNADAFAQSETAAKPGSGKMEPTKTDNNAEVAKANSKAATPAALAAAGVLAGSLGGSAIAATKPVASKRPQVVNAATTAPKTTTDVAAEGHVIEVRNSEVHRIDGDSVAPPATAADPVGTRAAQKLASLDPNQGMAAPNQKGASSCLSVDSDGNYWGFRNHCAYAVQFAYCLMGTSPIASCQDGAVAGSVAGYGFGALVTDRSLQETGVTHDFRWVACQGGVGEVIPRLEQASPPSGRCVR